VETDVTNEYSQRPVPQSRRSRASDDEWAILLLTLAASLSIVWVAMYAWLAVRVFAPH